MTQKTLAELTGRSDAQTWLDETPREDWEGAIRPGAGDADAALINALGAEKVGELFGVRAYWRGSATKAFSRACGEYSAAWALTVGEAIRDAELNEAEGQGRR